MMVIFYILLNVHLWKKKSEPWYLYNKHFLSLSKETILSKVFIDLPLLEGAEEGNKAAKAEEEKKKIPDDFFYNFEDMISQPHITQDSGLPQDYLNLV